VGGAVRAAAAAGVALATVHALGGEDMLRAAVASCGRLRLVAVSVLTSHTPDSYARAIGRAGPVDLNSEAVRLATLAVGAGVHGMVTSPLEIAGVRNVVGPTGWIVVPGIRPPGTDPGDQRRTADARAAARAGATHLVVGRPIVQAGDPTAVFASLIEQVEQE
jgi:orotidine-5'-phosphate decarboxylase